MSMEITLGTIIEIAEQKNIGIYEVTRAKLGDTVDVSARTFANMLNNKRFDRIFIRFGIEETEVFAAYNGIWIYTKFYTENAEGKPEVVMSREEIKELEEWLFRYSLVLRDDEGTYIEATNYLTLPFEDFKRLVEDHKPTTIIMDIGDLKNGAGVVWLTFIEREYNIPVVFDTRVRLK